MNNFNIDYSMVSVIDAKKDTVGTRDFFWIIYLEHQPQLLK
jgi:hypothetical protein